MGSSAPPSKVGRQSFTYGDPSQLHSPPSSARVMAILNVASVIPVHFVIIVLQVMYITLNICYLWCVFEYCVNTQSIAS